MPEKKKNSYDCAMRSCLNSQPSNKSLLFFAFPKEPERCKQWLDACENDDLLEFDTFFLHENYHVCSLHFPDSMFLNDLKNRLQPYAVPIIKEPHSTEMNEVECVVLNEAGTSTTTTTTTVMKGENDVQIENNFQECKIKTETLVNDEPCSINKRGIKFSILRNILQEKDKTPTTENNFEIKNESGISNDSDYDFQNICRVCLSNGEMKEIEKDNFKDIPIIDMLKPCIDFKLAAEKKLPKKICIKCVHDLKNVYDFIKRCENSKVFLENYLNKQEQVEREFKESFSADDVNDDNYSSDTDSSDNEPLINKITPKLEDKISNPASKLTSNRCLKCKMKFKYYSTLLNHTCEPKHLKISKQPRKTRGYQCSKCNEKFRHLYELAAHRKRMHRKNDEKPAKEKILTRCARCDIIFPTLEELADHRKAEHAQDRVVTCPVCSKKMSAKAYRSHKEIHCTKLKYCCEYCGRSFSSSSNFNRHMYIHFDMKPHVCEICGRGFRVRAKLTEHRLIHSTERRYMCETCGNSFRQKNVLRAHIQLKRCGKKAGRNGRGPVMKHECSECTEKFYTLKELRQHRSHTHGTDSKKAEARIYKCEKCEDSFTSTAFLKRHALIHAETKFICATCNRAFYTLERLQKHESIHDAVKNFICEVCSKAFASKLSLKCHMTVHTGEKKYHCQLCPKTFSQAGQLTSHTRTHTGSRPYQCPYCERAFALNGNLTVHIRTHTGERPYKCKFCDQAFYDSSSAKKHMTVKHGYGAME